MLIVTGKTVVLILFDFLQPWPVPSPNSAVTSPVLGRSRKTSDLFDSVHLQLHDHWHWLARKIEMANGDGENSFVDFFDFLQTWRVRSLKSAVTNQSVVVVVVENVIKKTSDPFVR